VVGNNKLVRQVRDTIPFVGRLLRACTHSDCPRSSDASGRRSRDSALCGSWSHARSTNGVNARYSAKQI